MTKFTVTASPTYDAAYNPTFVYRLRAYHGSGTSSVVETIDSWPSRVEADAACQRVNAGDKSGLRFALYADD